MFRRFTNFTRVIFILLFTGILASSCQKEIDDSILGGGTAPVNQKPKVGTVWTYRYYTYYGWPPPVEDWPPPK